jgi:hypothetical protein
MPEQTQMKIDNEYEKFLSEIGEGPVKGPTQDEYAAFMAEINNVPGDQPPWAVKPEEPLPPWSTQATSAPATLPPWQQQPQQNAYAPPYGGWPNPQPPY